MISPAANATNANQIHVSTLAGNKLRAAPRLPCTPEILQAYPFCSTSTSRNPFSKRQRVPLLRLRQPRGPRRRRLLGGGARGGARRLLLRRGRGLRGRLPRGGRGLRGRLLRRGLLRGGLLLPLLLGGACRRRRRGLPVGGRCRRRGVRFLRSRGGRFRRVLWLCRPLLLRGRRLLLRRGGRRGGRGFRGGRLGRGGRVLLRGLRSGRRGFGLRGGSGRARRKASRDGGRVVRA